MLHQWHRVEVVRTQTRGWAPPSSHLPVWPSHLRASLYPPQKSRLKPSFTLPSPAGWQAPPTYHDQNRAVWFYGLLTVFHVIGKRRHPLISYSGQESGPCSNVVRSTDWSQATQMQTLPRSPLPEAAVGLRQGKRYPPNRTATKTKYELMWGI